MMATKKKSFSDLYNMYMFLTKEIDQNGFGKSPPGVINKLRSKQEEIIDEMYDVLFGENPFTSEQKEDKHNPKPKRDGEYIIHTEFGPQSVKVEK
jgi:hypothetical protein